MLIVIDQLMPREAALALGERIAAAGWVDGNATSGAGAALAKRNRQLPEGSAALIAARREVQGALAQDATFLSAALPSRIVPPLFNMYGVGDRFGAHVDNAIRIDPTSGEQVRTDLSATLFLCDPDSYDGGELVITGAFGEVAYKLPAGSMLLYPSSSLHRVEPITRGTRIACFLWLQSLVADGEARAMLFDLDRSVQTLSAERGGDDSVVLDLTNLYHNFVRRWAKP